MFKVIHLVPAMEQGGVESVVVSLNRQMVERGIESVVASCGGRLVDEIVSSGGRHVVLPLKSKNLLTAASRARKLRMFLKSEIDASNKPVLVCTHSRVPAWLFHFANRKLHLPWITYAHGANSVSRYSEIMVKGIRTVVPSHYLADYLVDAYGIDSQRIAVIPNSVDGSLFDPARIDEALVEKKRSSWGLEGKKVIMSVGRLTPLKGYDLLIRAFVMLPERESCRLVIVGGASGKEDYLASLKKLAAELMPESDSVIFAGSQSKIPECLALADVVVSANTVKPETFGLSMAEALAMNRPVVAKAFGGALDVVRDGLDGELVKGDTPEQFTAAISRVLSRSFSGLRASVLERFDPSVTSSSTFFLYRSVLELP